MAKGQDSAALSGRFISPPDRRCQRLLSTNRRNMQQNLATQRSLDFCGPCAVLEPQSCDVLTYKYALNRGVASRGAAGIQSQGQAISKCTRRLFRTALKHRETCTAPSFAIPAIVLASDFWTPCGTPCSPIAPFKRVKGQVGNGKGLDRVLMDLGGTVG